MPRPKKPFSRVIEHQGVTVRVYERAAGSVLYIESRDAEGAKQRRSLGHRDPQLAEAQARAVAERLAELRHAGAGAPLTLGQLWRRYAEHRLPLLSAGRQAHARQHARFLLEHFGDGFRVEDLGQTHVDTFAAARRSGVLRGKHQAAKAAAKPVTVRDGTIRQNLNFLAALLRWARGFRMQGRRLLTSNPLEGVELPQEKNPRRPVASEERYRKTLAAAAHVDPSGRLACMLALARYTGRRVNAIAQLRASDLALSRDAIARSLARTGQDVALVEHMPHGAIHWREESDKLGYEALTPISKGARAALDAYLRTYRVVGDVPLFSDLAEPTRPTDKQEASYLLRRAEAKAGVEKLARGLWHPYRRLWASERKHLPDRDVAAGGGWRDLATMKRSYQQPDPATTLRAIENAPPATEPAPGGNRDLRAESGGSGLTSDSPTRGSGGAASA